MRLYKLNDIIENIPIEKVRTQMKIFISHASKNKETIFEELNTSDLFIPVLSKEYYESKFCMIELGVAYSYMYTAYKNA